MSRATLDRLFSGKNPRELLAASIVAETDWGRDAFLAAGWPEASASGASSVRKTKDEFAWFREGVHLLRHQRLAGLASLAISTLADALSIGPWETRLKAARDVLDRVGHGAIDIKRHEHLHAHLHAEQPTRAEMIGEITEIMGKLAPKLLAPEPAPLDATFQEVDPAAEAQDREAVTVELRRASQPPTIADAVREAIRAEQEALDEEIRREVETF